MEYEQDHSPSPPSSFKTKLKTSIFCASSCRNADDEYESKASESFSSNDYIISNNKNNDSNNRFSTWIKSELPEIKGLFSGKIRRNRHRGNSAEFRYDPLSYALNFEDYDSRIDQYPLRNFASRLPPSPTPEKFNGVILAN